MERNLSDLTANELGRLFPVSLVEYNSGWPALFQHERIKINQILGESFVFCIEHFGSTAIPKIMAKPVIDIMVEVQDLNKAHEIIPDLLEPLVQCIF